MRAATVTEISLDSKNILIALHEITITNMSVHPVKVQNMDQTDVAVITTEQ